MFSLFLGAFWHVTSWKLLVTNLTSIQPRQVVNTGSLLLDKPWSGNLRLCWSWGEEEMEEGQTACD
jgi:hypothetical protein